MLDDYTRPSLWKRLLIGGLLVVFASAGATAVAAFREVDRVVNALHIQPELKLGTELAQTDPGKPQTLMLLGSDRRPHHQKKRGPPPRPPRPPHHHPPPP